LFVDGEYLGKLLRTHFGVDAQPGYTSLGRLRVTVETVSPQEIDGAIERLARGAVSGRVVLAW